MLGNAVARLGVSAPPLLPQCGFAGRALTGKEARNGDVKEAHPDNISVEDRYQRAPHVFHEVSRDAGEAEYQHPPQRKLGRCRIIGTPP